MMPRDMVSDVNKTERIKKQKKTMTFRAENKELYMSIEIMFTSFGMWPEAHKKLSFDKCPIAQLNWTLRLFF